MQYAEKMYLVPQNQLEKLQSGAPRENIQQVVENDLDTAIRNILLRALLCPFLGGGRGCPCGGSPGGPVSWGAPGCLGPGSFPCLLHALRDGAVVPHTHY